MARYSRPSECGKKTWPSTRHARSRDAPPRRADEIAEAVDRADRRFVERRHERGARQMRGMVLDVLHPPPDPRGSSSPSASAMVAGKRAQADQVARARGDGALRPVPQQEQRLAQQMCARIARNREHVDIGAR